MSGEDGELARNLGFVEAMTMGGGTMIGAGIFILPGIAAEGAGPASSLSFAIAGVAALLAAISLSELATGMPIAGGSYHYVNRALGSFFGSIVGWGMWTGLMFASAFYMIGFGQYLVEPVPLFDGRVFVILLGLLGLGFLVGVNYYGTEESSTFQNVMIGAEAAVIVVYLGVGFFYIDTANLEPFAPTGPSGIIATTGLVFVTFLGFEIIATVAEEVENPGRNIPLTMILSVVLVTILYMIVMIVSTGIVPFDELGGSLVPVSDVAAVSMGTTGVVGIVAAAVLAAISSSNSSILAAARVVFAMGRDNLMNDWLNTTHSQFRTPHRAVVATGAVTALLIAAGLQVGAIIELLAEVASFSFLIAYALVHVSLVVIRRADPDEYEPKFEVPGPLYPAVPFVGVVLSVTIITQMDTVVIVIGCGIIAVGAMWYLGYVRRRDVDESLMGDAIVGEPVVSDESDDGYTVVVPIANPETQKDLLRLAAVNARTHAGGDDPKIVAVNVIKVPNQTSLEQNVQFEQERIEIQRELLESAREAAADLEVDVRTRAIVGRDIGKTILTVLDEENADHVVLGWRGEHRNREKVFGSTVDPVLERAPCEVSVVNLEREEIGSPVALAGPGPHAPVAARRAAEFATLSDAKPTLLNVQQPTDDADIDPIEAGESMIESVADEAGLEPGTYEPSVIVADDVQSAILENIEEYDTVSAGVSEQSAVSKILFGSIAEQIERRAEDNVVMIRGPYETSRSVREAVAERLAD
ncbi:amino acid permease [Natronorubrum daqingense]|uniref:Amino acid transporter n=1 Tax=Natronorubrum daqingense TaxID=588898 RepID=A0A1N7E118_9EURY|nr:amino acid permease [Natronorubrum daqingense]APX96285.1 amino acid transporter [Natronorubrum daqingense]SIR81635.1 Amino acid transporter [Natronorubrum daqingense]